MPLRLEPYAMKVTRTDLMWRGGRMSPGYPTGGLTGPQTFIFFNHLLVSSKNAKVQGTSTLSVEINQFLGIVPEKLPFYQGVTEENNFPFLRGKVFLFSITNGNVEVISGQLFTFLLCLLNLSDKASVLND